ncbi:MAG TPA: hypothetical protein VL098_11410 [Flavipsychrobacter sp.]|nr:hypothetical protein [Flavipsychrobacter sp.]
MKYSYKIVLAVIAFAISFPLSSSAQFNNFPKFLKRFEIGGSYAMSSAEYRVKQRFLSQDYSIDTTIKFNMNSVAGIGGMLGTYVPLSRLGQKSILALNIDLMYNALVWDKDVTVYSPTGGTVTNSLTGGTLMVGMPVGLDFKFGCDAVGRKDVRFCTTLGGGVLPSFAMTSIDDVNDIAGEFGVSPYVKAEVGMFTGICWKIRAMYSFGVIDEMSTLMDKTVKSDFGQSNTQLIQKSSLNLSLILMPFSFTWGTQEWWNTF